MSITVGSELLAPRGVFLSCQPPELTLHLADLGSAQHLARGYRPAVAPDAVLARLWHSLQCVSFASNPLPASEGVSLSID